MADLTAFLNGVEITSFITGAPVIPQMVGDFGQLTINDLPTIGGINAKGFWDILNPASSFFGEDDLTTNTIDLKRGGETFYSGEIQQIEIAPDRTATITLRSQLQRGLEQGAIYVSDVPETPTAIVQRIAELYKIPLSYDSFAVANEIYTKNKVLLMSFLSFAELDILEAMQSIAEMGIGRVYILNGILHYDVFMASKTAPIFEVTDSQLKTATMLTVPQVSRMEKEKISGWSIEWVGGLTATGSARLAKTINAGPDDPIQITTLQTAIWIGDTWQKFLNTPQSKVIVGVPSIYGKSLEINDSVLIEQTKENWDPFVMDITEIVATDSVLTMITGIQRAS